MTMQPKTKTYIYFAITAWSLALGTTNPQFTELLLSLIL